MPKRNDIESILIIGAGPIIIGQACEFDYSGTQACRALREEGYRIILVNSNHVLFSKCQMCKFYQSSLSSLRGHLILPAQMHNALSLSCPHIWGNNNF